MSPFASPLKRRILLRLLVAAALLSALLLAAFLAAYRGQLENERSRASAGFNLLLQAALENAMLKRDVPGLRDSTRAANGVVIPAQVDALADWLPPMIAKWQAEPPAPLPYGGAESWDTVAERVFAAATAAAGLAP